MSDRFDETHVPAQGQQPGYQYGAPPQYAPQYAQPQYPQQYGHGGPPGYGPPPGYEPPGLPSTTTTIVITALFGLFGLIPASMHSKRAQAMGVPGTRYWKAFGITFAIAMTVYIALIAIMFSVLFAVVETVDTGASPAVEVPTVTEDVVEEPLPTPSAPDSADLPPSGEAWTAASITPLLESYADDEAEDWGAFSGDSIVTIPCGGQGAHGLSPGTVETTSGGVDYAASAQILTDAGEASREFARLRSLVADCGAHDYISESSGTVLTRCEAPIVESLAPVIRYEQVCDLNPTAWPTAIIQSGNAVVALGAPTKAELDALLPGMMVELYVG